MADFHPLAKINRGAQTHQSLGFGQAFAQAAHITRASRKFESHRPAQLIVLWRGDDVERRAAEDKIRTPFLLIDIDLKTLKRALFIASCRVLCANHDLTPLVSCRLEITCNELASKAFPTDDLGIAFTNTYSLSSLKFIKSDSL